MKRLLAAAVGGVGVVVTSVAPSYASTVQYSVPDPLYDQTYHGNVSLAQKKQVDIVRFSYGRGTDRVWARAEVRDLNRQTRLPDFFVFPSNTNPVMLWYPSFGTYPQLQNAQGHYICNGKGRLTVNYTDDYIQMGFPKSCFPKGRLYRGPQAETRIATGGVDVDDGTGRGHGFYPNP